MNKKAICTLVLGHSYIDMFNRYCRKDWQKYADKYGFDLQIFDTPLDNSERAQSRSPAWQKCLIPLQQKLQQYEQLVWIDSDILINPNAPDITEGVQEDQVGAVDQYAIPNPEDAELWLKRSYSELDKKGVPYIKNLTGKDFHENYGITSPFNTVVQTGVMVFSPKFHKQTFKFVYDQYEDKGDPQWNYEMRPLSHELQKNHTIYWLNPKFNMIWSKLKNNLYPFLSDKSFEFISTGLFKKYKNEIIRKKLFKAIINQSLENNYFLHFSGSSSEMKYKK